MANREKLTSTMQLALESSTKVCSVAFQNAEGEVFEKRTEVKGSHSEELFLFIKELMKEHGFRLPDLSAVIVSAGPGSYTGLRISASAVKGLLFGTDVPLLAADTLASFAAAVIEKQPDIKTIHSVIDARRVHLYHRQFGYDSGKLTAAGEVGIIPIEDFEKKVKAEEAVIGTGLGRVDEEALEGIRLFDEGSITAASLFKLAEMDGAGEFVEEVDVPSFEPRYYTSI